MSKNTAPSNANPPKSLIIIGAIVALVVVFFLGMQYQSMQTQEVTNEITGVTPTDVVTDVSIQNDNTALDGEVQRDVTDEFQQDVLNGEQQPQMNRREVFKSSPLETGIPFSLSIPDNCTTVEGSPPAVEVDNPPDTRSIVCNMESARSFEIFPQAGGRGVEKVLSSEIITLSDYTWDKRTWQDGELNGISYSLQNENVTITAHFDEFGSTGEELFESMIQTFQKE